MNAQANCLLYVTDHGLKSWNRINVIGAGEDRCRRAARERGGGYGPWQLRQPGVQDSGQISSGDRRQGCADALREIGRALTRLRGLVDQGAPP